MLHLIQKSFFTKEGDTSIYPRTVEAGCGPEKPIRSGGSELFNPTQARGLA